MYGSGHIHQSEERYRGLPQQRYPAPGLPYRDDRKRLPSKFGDGGYRSEGVCGFGAVRDRTEGLRGGQSFRGVRSVRGQGGLIGGRGQFGGGRGRGGMQEPECWSGTFGRRLEMEGRGVWGGVHDGDVRERRRTDSWGRPLDRNSAPPPQLRPHTERHYLPQENRGLAQNGVGGVGPARQFRDPAIPRSMYEKTIKNRAHVQAHAQPPLAVGSFHQRGRQLGYGTVGGRVADDLDMGRLRLEPQGAVVRLSKLPEKINYRQIRKLLVEKQLSKDLTIKTRDFATDNAIVKFVESWEEVADKLNGLKAENGNFIEFCKNEVESSDESRSEIVSEKSSENASVTAAENELENSSENGSNQPSLNMENEGIEEVTVTVRVTGLPKVFEKSKLLEAFSASNIPDPVEVQILPGKRVKKQNMTTTAVCSFNDDVSIGQLELKLAKIMIGGCPVEVSARTGNTICAALCRASVSAPLHCTVKMTNIPSSIKKKDLKRNIANHINYEFFIRTFADGVAILVVKSADIAARMNGLKIEGNEIVIECEVSETAGDTNVSPLVDVVSNPRSFEERQKIVSEGLKDIPVKDKKISVAGKFTEKEIKELAGIGAPNPKFVEVYSDKILFHYEAVVNEDEIEKILKKRFETDVACDEKVEECIKAVDEDDANNNFKEATNKDGNPVISVIDSTDVKAETESSSPVSDS